MSGWYMPRDSGEWHYCPGEHESGINAGLSLCGATDDPGLGKVNAPDCATCTATLAAKNSQTSKPPTQRDV